MSTREDSAPSPVVGSRDELVAWIAAGSKPASAWRIGTEHEKFLFHTDTLRPVPYAGPRGVRALMEGLIARFGWQPIMEGDNIIALKRPDGEAGRHRVARARRPVRAVRRSAAHRARGRRRDARASRPGAWPPARPSASASSASASRRTGRSSRDAAHAQAALRGDDALHADGRHARPRHDVSHRHHPGEPRLRGRGRHGQEVPRVAGAAADRDGDLRLLALHRGQAQRLPVHAQRGVARHRPRRAPACCRSCSSPA